jgi:hypothetical protein
MKIHPLTACFTSITRREVLQRDQKGSKETSSVEKDQ